ncbi:cation:proton antiporter [Romboutsia sp. 1001216sp1]|uniref:cation:proton antiporter domain-containing protein n=1 Tax=unclassified Romboutsia TaxID=2626894 RepID=UPI0018A8A8A5|nr:MULTISPECIES: cation:proton antiporter [unclassified Romboutsia]MDB8793574.1 cation:proton antiporter [Romboutsia sp. 1001216sp1]MDB8794971.1 cation:proton antiporter [Romboutsia sp. 1001216sp1]MDB8798782.1 cation:proton antiporter [Romboutsia sp. 1001216sp1]
MIILISLVIIGILANISGKLVEKVKLPSLIGMMVLGMVIGPSIFNLVPKETLEVSSGIKDIALVTVLFIGGLGINVSQIKQIGRPAVLLSIIPATLEGFTIAFLCTIFLDFTFIQGAILGFIIAAVSPAVLIPAMVSLIERKLGQDKAIPQMLLVGASCDDTVAITLFTTLLTLYTKSYSGESVSIFNQIMIIPLTIIISLVLSFLIFKIIKLIISKVDNKNIKVIIAFSTCIGMRFIEKNLHVGVFNSLLAVMVYGFLIRNYMKDISKEILDTMNRLWKIGKIYLFTFVGIAINPTLVGKYFIVGVIILTISLSVRSIGVFISLIGTNLTIKEKVFCMIAYLPKATVQSAKASIPLEMGVAGGDIMQAIAILSILITAPIGSIGINMTCDKILHKGDNKDFFEDINIKEKNIQTI